jgi:hypothetical protein
MPRRSPPERGSVRTSHRSQPQPHRKRPASTLLPAATGLQSEDPSPQRSVDQLACRHRAVIGSPPARDQRERRVLRRQALVPRDCLDLQRDARLDADVAAGNHQHGPTTWRRRRRRHQATCGSRRRATARLTHGQISPASDLADARALALDCRLQRARDTRHILDRACALDKEQAPGGARSEALPLLHRCTGSSDGLTAPIHARRHCHVPAGTSPTRCCIARPAAPALSS